MTTRPSKRLISGIDRRLPEIREQIIGAFPGELQLPRVRAQVNSVIPPDLASGTDSDSFECLGIGPKPEDVLGNPFHLVAPYGRRVQLLNFSAECKIAIWTENSANIFTRLRKERIRIETHDLRIAAISQDALLLSANLRNFQIVPGLHVEDWIRD